MVLLKNKPHLFPGPIKLAFLISIFYWIYLAFNTRMGIEFDAIGYESLGKMISEQGWTEFFRAGPNREPFYPALVALSMGLGKFFGLSYQLIQAFIQLFFLFLTQILTLRILRLLKISNLLIALVILYLGISPAIVNSALSLYSEIATYPIILTVILLTYKSWLSFSGPRKRVILLAIATSLLFVLMVLNKGIFEFMTPFFLFLLLISVLFTRNRKFIINALVYLVVILTIFYSLIIGYKLINKAYNGRFALTDRGAVVLYNATARRMEPLSPERFLTALAYVPGEGVCDSIFGKERCSFWSPVKAGEFSLQKISELERNNIAPKEVDKILILISVQKILKNPMQYILFTVIEGAKMFFWESTQIGYVAYPPMLAKTFAWMPLKNGLRLTISLVTLIAFIYLVGLLWRKKKAVFRTEGPLIFLYLCLLFILSFVGFYTISGILTRYLFPIAPLYLFVIAYVSQKTFLSKEKKKRQ